MKETSSYQRQISSPDELEQIETSISKGSFPAAIQEGTGIMVRNSVASEMKYVNPLLFDVDSGISPINTFRHIGSLTSLKDIIAEHLQLQRDSSVHQRVDNRLDEALKPRVVESVTAGLTEEKYGMKDVVIKPKKPQLVTFNTIEEDCQANSHRSSDDSQSISFDTDDCRKLDDSVNHVSSRRSEVSLKMEDLDHFFSTQQDSSSIFKSLRSRSKRFLNLSRFMAFEAPEKSTPKEVIEDDDGEEEDDSKSRIDLADIRRVREFFERVAK